MSYYDYDKKTEKRIRKTYFIIIMVFLVIAMVLGLLDYFGFIDINNFS